MSRWKLPVAVIVGVTVTVDLFMVLTDMGPNLWLVTTLCGLGGLTMWFLADLDRSAAATTHPWPTGTATDTARTDWGATAIQRTLMYSRGHDHVNERLYGNLVELIDDQLVAAHGIDRLVDPDAAEVALGPQLWRFVQDPSSAASLRHLRRVDEVVTLIEQL